jgi:protease-4
MSVNFESHDHALAAVLSDFVQEKRRKRRWGIFFKFLVLIIAVVCCIAFCTDNSATMMRDTPHTALIDVQGEIMPGGFADADRIAGALQQAFKDKGTKGVILRINSPGGSPVQSDYIYNEIMRLRAKYPDVPVYAVCSDICASGAYFVASAAQDIYANPSSLVGSIGVIMNGFGFTGAMEKLGVTRRVVIAGKYKDFMDPFAPQSAEQQQFAQNMVNDVHEQFIEAVKEGRGKRLTNDPNLFTGMAWTGNEAKKLGLIDGYGSAGYVAREVIKVDKIVNYTIKPTLLDQFASRMGASMANAVMSKFDKQLTE